MNNNATGAEIDYPSVNTCPHCGQTLKQVKYVYGLACEADTFEVEYNDA